jgi:hypothetical protein
MITLNMGVNGVLVQGTNLAIVGQQMSSRRYLRDSCLFLPPHSGGSSMVIATIILAGTVVDQPTRHHIPVRPSVCLSVRDRLSPSYQLTPKERVCANSPLRTLLPVDYLNYAW